MRSILFVSIVLGLGAAGARCQPSCPGQGATLDVLGGRLGDDLVLTLSGSPGVAGVLGFDLGAGSGGDVLGVLAPGSGQLLEISTTGLQVTSSFSIAPSIDLIEASSLGTEWLLAQGATPHQLSRLDPASGVITTIGALSVAPSVSDLVTLRSQSVPLCLAIIPSTTLVPLVTDTVTTIPSVPLTLPWVGGLSILVFNE